MGDIYGTLGTDETYVRAFAKALMAIWRDGTAATLQAYIAGRL